MTRKPATNSQEYTEYTRDENKARELHPADMGAIDLDAFQAMSQDGRRQAWMQASDSDRRGLALQIIRRGNHGPDEATIAVYLEELERRFGPSPVERAVMGALERLAESHQRSAETAETTEERAYFRRWAGAFRKALLYYIQGTRPEPTESGAWLVASATRDSRVHRVSRDGACSCEAQNRGCWHSALITGVETAGDDLDRFDGGDEEPPEALGRRLCRARSRLLSEAA